ncbi:MAG: VacB/RNase II family 3'-5' exoribonuclease [Acidobacteria bacterium]|nr:VacB/RNase II family 3'-5' exoribonuclease [Acidobacteriota bacterium]
MNLEQLVLDFLKRQEDPVGIRALLHGVGLFPRDRGLLKSILREMVREGSVVKTGTRYWVPNGARQTVEIKREKTRLQKSRVGRLWVNPRGFGFVSFEGSGADWFIPEHAMGNASHGDWVRVEKTDGGQRGRIAGKIVAIESMERTTLVGVLERQWRQRTFTPFGQPPVDWARLKGLPDDLEDGLVLVFDRQIDGTFRFNRVIGSFDDAQVDETLALAEQGIAMQFPAQIVEEANSFPDPYPFDVQDRVDFRDEMVFTVDGADARDFDDAIHIKYIGNEIELGVHIADVAHFVPEGCPLDLWARKTGNSTYLPHRAFPMLPERLSTDLCSLRPHEERYTLSVVMTLSRKGDLKNYKVGKGLIRSAFRLTYDQVQKAVIDRDPEVRASLEAVLPSLENAIQLAMTLKAKRRKAGGLNLDLAEPVLRMDENHLMQSISGRHQTEANQMIEMYMVLANEVVARHMRDAGIGIAYRHHGPPDPERIEKLFSFLATRGLDIPHPMPELGQALNLLLNQIEERPDDESNVLQTALLKCMKLAEYHPEHMDHFGLASECYTHFTSPIRRYADLLLHQRLTRLLEQPDLGPEHFDDAALSEICMAISRTERASSRAEQTFRDMKLLRHLKTRLGETFEGVISDVQNFGLFVRLGDLWVDGLLREDAMGGERFEHNPERMCWVGARSGRLFSLGDRIEVRIDRVDLFRRECDLSLVSAVGPAPGRVIRSRPASPSTPSRRHGPPKPGRIPKKPPHKRRKR